MHKLPETPELWVKISHNIPLLLQCKSFVDTEYVRHRSVEKYGWLQLQWLRQIPELPKHKVVKKYHLVLV